LARAVSSRGLTVAQHWPLERALLAGHDQETALVVLDGYPSSLDLRVMADVTAAREDLTVLVLGPLEPDVEGLVALASGANGFLPLLSSPTMVADAVDALLRGHAVLPRAVSFPLVQHLRRGGRGLIVTRRDGGSTELTNREWEVLVLLRQGRTTGGLARQLVVSRGTVRTHIAALVRKLGVADRSALTTAAPTDTGSCLGELPFTIDLVGPPAHS
jgi:DNA-binding NarL/FixJ family response regulator